MKFNLRFFISWLLAAVIMFTLFYVWHGYFLNDFRRIEFPYVWFVSFAAFTYLIISFGLIVLFNASLFKQIDNFLTRGLLSGAVVGFCLFMIVTVLHISFTKQLTASYLLLDCFWQMIEQAVGGLTVALCHVFILSHDHETT